jgi:predicted negative regulator of RcsB-dependent stress response
MAHFDLHEQEQISKIKYFWRDWGKYITSVVVVAIIAYVSSVVWNWHNESQAQRAAVIYAKFMEGVNGNNSGLALQNALLLEKNYPATEYSSLASIWAAKLVAPKDTNTAIKLLNWTINHASDKGLVNLARLDLATLFIDQKRFTEAQQLLMQKHDPVFDGQYYETLGDLYVAQGNLVMARDAYKAALQKSPQDSPVGQSIQFKLDVLGS